MGIWGFFVLMIGYSSVHAEVVSSQAAVSSSYQSACLKQKMDFACATLEADPQVKDMVLRCDASDSSQTAQAMTDACLNNVLGVWGEILNTNAHNIALSAAGMITETLVSPTEGPRNLQAFLNACKNSDSCREKLFRAAYHRDPTPKEKTELDEIPKSWFQKPKMDYLWSKACGPGFSCATEDAWLKGKVEEIFGSKRRTASPSFVNQVQGFISSRHQKYNCLNDLGRREMWCYAVASVVDPALALGAAGKLPQLAKLARATEVAQKIEHAGVARKTLTSNERMRTRLAQSRIGKSWDTRAEELATEATAEIREGLAQTVPAHVTKKDFDIQTFDSSNIEKEMVSELRFEKPQSGGVAKLKKREIDRQRELARMHVIDKMVDTDIARAELKKEILRRFEKSADARELRLARIVDQKSKDSLVDDALSQFLYDGDWENAIEDGAKNLRVVISDKADVREERLHELKNHLRSEREWKTEDTGLTLEERNAALPRVEGGLWPGEVDRRRYEKERPLREARNRKAAAKKKAEVVAHKVFMERWNSNKPLPSEARRQQAWVRAGKPIGHDGYPDDVLINKELARTVGATSRRATGSSSRMNAPESLKQVCTDCPARIRFFDDGHYDVHTWERSSRFGQRNDINEVTGILGKLQTPESVASLGAEEMSTLRNFMTGIRQNMSRDGKDTTMWTAQSRNHFLEKLNEAKWQEMKSSVESHKRFVAEVEGVRVNMVVCVKAPCSSPDIQPGDIATVFPECGPGIYKVPESLAIDKFLAQMGSQKKVSLKGVVKERLCN